MLISGLLLPIIVLAVLLAGFLYGVIGQWRDKRRYPPPGRVANFGAASLHVLDQGTGHPPVVLEAGVAGTLLGWARVQPELAELTRVVSYDRTGLGWSAPIPVRRTSENILAELAAVVNASAASSPAILVGHSFGALLALAYAERHPELVAGLVLVDPAGVASWAEPGASDRKRLGLGIRLSHRGALLARLGVVRMTLDLLASGGRRLPGLIGKTAAGRGASTMTRLIGEVQLLPPECAPRIRSHWSNAKSFSAMAQYLDALPPLAAAVRDISLPARIPITVLSAATATASELRERERWVSASAAGRHIRVHDSGHWIQIRRPEVVIGAVQEMLGSIRTDVQKS